MAEAPEKATSALVSGMAVLLAVACAPLALIALWFGMRSGGRRPSSPDHPAEAPSAAAAMPAPTAEKELVAPAPPPVSSQRYWGSGWDATCGDRPAGFVPPGGL